MLDKKELKVHGLRFARSLQMLVKMANMFSADHKSVSGLMRRSYEQLNPLLKQTRHLTFGFVEQRVLLNNILTVEDTLKPLENEFLKRGIGAVTFDAGITLAAFTRAIAALAASPKVIEESGGLMPFLEQRQLEFVRIFPANKNEVRNEDGDTVLDVGSEEYLISKALANVKTGSAQGIEAILGHLEATGDGSGGGGGTGLAVSTGTGSATGVDGGKGTGAVGVVYGLPQAVSGYGQGSGSYLTEVQRMAEQKFEASLANPDEDPHKAYVELSKILMALRPDQVLSNLAGSSVGQGDASSKEEVTAEVFEDTALRWALRRLAASPTGEEGVIVEEQIFRVLMRSLQATHAASRLAQKLAEYAREYALPKPIFERLQQEVRWLTLTPQAKFRELISLEHLTASQFRRMLDLIKELIRLGSPEQAVALGARYFSIFEDHASIRIEEVGRIPELLRSLGGIQAEFWMMAEQQLAQALFSTALNQVVHVQVVNALVALALIAATDEDFDLVRKVGSALEESGVRAPTVHRLCCVPATGLLLPPSAADRITEIFLERKHDSPWLKTVTIILRWAEASSIERIFLRLDTEPQASNRLALVRLLGRLGPSGLPAARQRLKHSEWYVVRNACKILAELKDPDLLANLSPVLGHEDERVQSAALQAVKESRLPGRKTVIARALPLLSPALVEHAMSELMFQMDGDSLPILEEHFTTTWPDETRVLVRVVDLIATIPQAPAAEVLARISLNEQLHETIRKAAQQALNRRSAAKENISQGVAAMEYSRPA